MSFSNKVFARMSQPMIIVENLSKKYIIRHQVGKYVSARDILENALRHPAHVASQLFFRRSKQSLREEFWSLRDINFSVNEGEVLGIIGKNGAGKSTLLKILTRVTYPTNGRAMLRGRIASLLEVGTGFHPELTGRENIFLNASILGMKRLEIEKQFDSIVDFSGIEQFLDTPVKRYSSGMYVRLAFAVAAHIQSDVLLVDEVLAVGDVSFQRKCLTKMHEVSQQIGRTILFVSHNMNAIQDLCPRSMYLKGGQIQIIDKTSTVVNAYLENRFETVKTNLDQARRSGSGDARLRSIYLTDQDQRVRSNFSSGEEVWLHLEFDVLVHKEKLEIFAAIGIDNSRGVRICHLHNKLKNQTLDVKRDTCHVVCHFPKLPVTPGKYLITTLLSINNVIADTIDEAFIFEVEEGDYFQSGMIDFRNQGSIFIDHDWFVV